MTLCFNPENNIPTIVLYMLLWSLRNEDYNSMQNGKKLSVLSLSPIRHSVHLIY